MERTKKRGKTLNQTEKQKIVKEKVEEEEDDIEMSLDDIPPSERAHLPKMQHFAHSKLLFARKIMIVDDEPMNIKGLQILMRVIANIEENQIICATNGLEAIHQFTRCSSQLNPITLIFMDINMPLMDGIEATKEIRKVEKSNHLQRASICAYTSWADIQTKIKCGEAGMDNYFSKPLSTEQLGIALNKYYFKKNN